MSNEELTKQVVLIRRTMEHMHSWTQSIAVATEDHATSLEGLSREMKGVKDQIIMGTRETEDKLNVAADKLAETFSRVDGLLGGSLRSGRDERGSSNSTSMYLITLTPF